MKDIVAELRPDLGEVKGFYSSNSKSVNLGSLSSYHSRRGLMILCYLFSN